MKLNSITTRNGKKVWLFSWQGFDKEEVAEAIRPIPVTPAKKFSFKLALPWILMGIMFVGLGVSLYFNWTQYHQVEKYADYYDQLDAQVDDLQSNYNDIYNQNNTCQSEAYSWQKKAENLQAQIDQQERTRTNVILALTKLRFSFKYHSDTLFDAKSKAYDLYSDITYNNVKPSADDLSLVYNTAGSAYNELETIEEQIDQIDRLLSNQQ